MTLTSRLPRPGQRDPDSVYEAFVEWTGEQGLTLYPAQEEALLELVSGSNVVLATPTGSMHGSYRMVDEDGEAFDIAIPKFALVGPV